jgi:monoamine oxidase
MSGALHELRAENNGRVPVKTQVAIVGGGLAGLALASQLHQSGVDFQLFEARDRFGGRIAALETPAGAVDLGPSWFWPGQPRMAALLKGLTLAYPVVTHTY